MTSTLQNEFQYYLDHQDQMVEEYNGKFIVIKEQQVIGAYDDELTALTETQKNHKLGTFLIQLVTEGNTAYSQTFHSRVVFSS